MEADIERLAVVRVRGILEIKPAARKTLELLSLKRKNHCIILPKTKQYLGMLNRVKDFVTYGPVREETFRMLVEKKGELFNQRLTDKKGIITYNKFIEVNGKKYNKAFRLNSPRKGYAPKGVKMPFSRGGALGFRGDNINDLIQRMM